MEFFVVALAAAVGFGLGISFGPGIIANPWVQECFYFCPDGTQVSGLCWKGAGNEMSCVDSLAKKCPADNTPVS
ncbi:MAG: hypothetical protein AAGB02_06220 [Pseudomonadota bacterium]